MVWDTDLPMRHKHKAHSPRSSWRRHSHVRPTWWPEEESWPPHRKWRSVRPRFFPRLAVGMAFFFFFSTLACTISLYLAAGVAGSIDLPLEGAIIGLVALVTVATLVVLIGGRRLRSMVTPIDQLLEASDRLAEGDYSIRVEERGTGEIRSLARSFNTMVERLEGEDENRRDFLADMTHELRTPLTVLQGNLEGMLDGIYPRDDPHLQSIVEEAQQLSHIVEDLKTFSLAESGALQLNREPIDLDLLGSETAAAFRPQALQQGVRILVDAPAELPLLSADPARIREVLTNLISNALRYTTEGGTIRLEFSEAGDDELMIRVVDTGVGILPEDLPRIFDRFYRTPDSSGSGLGLAIVKRLVEAHGSEIKVMSERGSGTTFSMLFPRKNI
jgi:two-component system, OmpR family, sensor histidine kinase BaeS